MRTFVRLLGFLRPYRGGVVASAVLASLASAATVALPDLVGRAVDGIRTNDRAALTGFVLAIVGAGVLRLGLSVARRLIAGRVSLGVEYDVRNNLYSHLLSLELAF